MNIGIKLLAFVLGLSVWGVSPSYAGRTKNQGAGAAAFSTTSSSEEFEGADAGEVTSSDTSENNSSDEAESLSVVGQKKRRSKLSPESSDDEKAQEDGSRFVKRAKRETPKRRRVRTRSKAYQSPLSVGSPFLRLGLEKGEPVLATPRVDGKALNIQKTFPGAQMILESDVRDLYFSLKTSSPYGNVKYFADVLNDHLINCQTFSQKKRALILIYNLIRNNGRLISDYSFESDPRIHQVLKKIGYTEEYTNLRLPHDIAVETYTEVFALIPDSQRELLSFRFLGHENILNWNLVEDWIVANLDDDLPVAHVDHILPRSRAGSNDLRNAAICSSFLNIRKSDHYLFELLDFCSATPDPSPVRRGRYTSPFVSPVRFSLSRSSRPRPQAVPFNFEFPVAQDEVSF